MMVNDEMMIVEVIELWRPLREGPWQGMPGQNNVLFKATLEECCAGQDLGNFCVKINYKIFEKWGGVRDQFGGRCQQWIQGCKNNPRNEESSRK